MKTFTLLLAACVTTSLAGCGDKPADGTAAGEDCIKGLCTGSEFKMEACPADKRVGSCSTPEGTRTFYTEGAYPMDAARAEKSCKEASAGEWKAGG